MPISSFKDDPSLAAFLQSAVAMAQVDAQTHVFVRVNDAFCHLAGRSAEELAHLRPADLTHPDDRDSDASAFERCLVEGSDQWTSEKRYVRPNGSVRWVHILGLVMRREGRPWRTFAIVDDITRRKEAEQAMEASARLFRAAQDLSLQAFTVLRAVRDGEGRIVDFEWTYANPVAGRLLRRLPSELAGRRLLEELPTNRESGLFEMYVRTVETGDPSTVDLHYDADGIEGWFTNSTVKLEDGVAVSFWDITALKRAELQLRERVESEVAARAERERLLAEAREANRLKDEFLATLSHELRTPLNAIMGWAQLLLGNTDEVTRRHGLEAISRNASAQNRLVEDILDVSRIIGGKMRLDPSPLELTPVIRAAMDAVRPAAEAKGLDLSSSFSSHVRVNGDADRLQQVFWNLLSNAVKFTPVGRVSVSTEVRGPDVQVVVEDTGLGIDPSFLPYIFDRFSQADGSSTRLYGGLGLGLAIVRHLVELHGGAVAVASRGIGHGARFTVRLPALGSVADAGKGGSRRGATQRRHEHGAKADGVGTPDPLVGLRVLAVDDDKDELDLLVYVLGTHGAHVTAATSAAEAFAALQHETFDVFLSDIAMPGEDGYSLIRRIRNLGDRARAAVPAVALTAYARVEDRLAALAAGFEQHVAKPVAPDELLAVVRSLVRPRTIIT